MNNRESFEATDFFKSMPDEMKLRSGKKYANLTLNGEFELFCLGFNAAIASQAQQESEQLSFDDNGQLVDKSQAKRIAELEEKEKVLDCLINEFEGKHRFMGTMRVHKKFPHDLHTGLNPATVCAERIDIFQWVFRSNGECSFKKAVMNLLSQKNGE